MVITHLESALEKTAASWAASVAGLDPLAQELLVEPSWKLSGVLLGTALLGGATIDESAMASSRALEFLDQSLRLGRANMEDSDNYIENNLLITDYLYARAIDEVIDIDAPPVIGFLARAIMATASDRAEGEFVDHRRHLLAAALEIGSFLGGIEGPQAEAIAAAAVGAGQLGAGEWAKAYPPGPVRDYLRQSLTTAAG
jgi:hypothetical protein